SLDKRIHARKPTGCSARCPASGRGGFSPRFAREPVSRGSGDVMLPRGAAYVRVARETRCMLHNQTCPLHVYSLASGDVCLAQVVARLQGLLPQGGAVALAWEDALLATGCVSHPVGSLALQEDAGRLLQQ